MTRESVCLLLCYVSTPFPFSMSNKPNQMSSRLWLWICHVIIFHFTSFSLFQPNQTKRASDYDCEQRIFCYKLRVLWFDFKNEICSKGLKLSPPPVPIHLSSFHYSLVTPLSGASLALWTGCSILQQKERDSKWTKLFWKKCFFEEKFKNIDVDMEIWLISKSIWYFLKILISISI